MELCGKNVTKMPIWSPCLRIKEHKDECNHEDYCNNICCLCNGIMQRMNGKDYLKYEKFNCREIEFSKKMSLILKKYEKNAD